MSCSTCGNNTRSVEYNAPRVHNYTMKSEGGCDCESTTKVARWTALPLYKHAELPFDMDIIAGSNEEGKAWRLPLSRILAGGDLNRLQYSIDKKVSKLEYNLDQVTPAFIAGPNTSMEEAIADSEANKAQFLVVGVDNNAKNNVIIQASGFLTSHERMLTK